MHLPRIVVLLLAAVNAPSGLASNVLRHYLYTTVLTPLKGGYHFNELCEARDTSGDHVGGDKELARAFEETMIGYDCAASLPAARSDRPVNRKIVKMAKGLLRAVKMRDEQQTRQDVSFCHKKERKMKPSGASIAIFIVYGVALAFVLLMIVIPTVRFQIMRRKRGVITQLGLSTASEAAGELPTLPWEDSKKAGGGDTAGPTNKPGPGGAGARPAAGGAAPAARGNKKPLATEVHPQMATIGLGRVSKKAIPKVKK